MAAKKANRQKATAGKANNDAVSAVYVGDSTNYHIYQVANGKKVVGSLYFDKESEVPKEVTLNLLTPANKEWRGIVEKLRGNAREGSKNYDRLSLVLAGD